MMSQYNYYALAHCFLAITYLSTDHNIIIMICYKNMHFITKDLYIYIIYIYIYSHYIHYIHRSKRSSGKTYIYGHTSFGTSTDLVQFYSVKMTT